MLILDYLDLGHNLNNVQKANLYSHIINRDVETTRQNFSRLENERKKADLKYIRDLFNKIGLKDKAQLVEKDINKYHMKK